MHIHICLFLSVLIWIGGETIFNYCITQHISIYIHVYKYSIYICYYIVNYGFLDANTEINCSEISVLVVL